jgi:ADP-ribose pyrophosphatase YjhB (NUDIX family)
MNPNRFSLRVAVYLLLIKANKILLLRRSNTGWEDGKYSLIAGHLDGNEQVTRAMAREALEEAGIIIQPKDLQVVHTMHRNSNKEYIDFFLTANKWKGEPQIREKDKADEMRWFSLDKLPENIIPPVKKAIDDYMRKETFSEFGW